MYNEQINLVKDCVKILAQSVNDTLDTNYPQVYLETIYTPFIAHLIYTSSLTRLKVSASIFKNFQEFYIYINDNEPATNGAFDRDIEWKTGNYDLTVFMNLNLYEKIVYKIFRISYLELKFVEPKEEINVLPRYDLRIKLKNIINNKKNSLLLNVVDFLPLSLFEILIIKNKEINYPNTKVTWLGQIHNEKYLFYLAHLKVKGVYVIGEGHGGGFSQVNPPFGNEIAEMILSDEYHAPSWSVDNKAFPNTRASRNRFLNLKSSFKNLIYQKKPKLLVIMYLLYDGEEPPYNKSLVKTGSVTNFLKLKIKELEEHFSMNLDFKIHPKQKDDILSLRNLIHQSYPGAEIIETGDVRVISKRYSGVIFMDFWGTAIIELSSRNTPIFVYLGPELSIDKDYQAFLWNTRLSSTREKIGDGVYIELDNKKYRDAYGAKFTYPFHFAKLINKVKKFSKI